MKANAKTRPKITEKAFQQQVMDYARLRGWLVMHVRDSRKSAGTGWPDLSMVRDGRFVAAELKTENGKPTPAQLEWLEALGECGVETHLWRPSMWNEIQETLK